MISDESVFSPSFDEMQELRRRIAQLQAELSDFKKLRDQHVKEWTEMYEKLNLRERQLERAKDALLFIIYSIGVHVKINTGKLCLETLAEIENMEKEK